MRRFANALIDLIYPAKCAGCGGLIGEVEVPPFCAKCDETVVETEGPLCLICGIPSKGGEGRNFICPECSREKPAFDRARCLFLYGGAVRDAILKLKYGSSPQVAGMFSGRFFGNLDFDCDLIMPVPLHKRRIIKRGYNQSVLIAVEASRALKKPLDRRTLVRVRDTPPQSGLSRGQRFENMKSAFGVSAPEKIRDRRILLVDDVITTGATVNECAKVLKRCGAARVDVFAIARR